MKWLLIGIGGYFVLGLMAQKAYTQAQLSCSAGQSTCPGLTAWRQQWGWLPTVPYLYDPYQKPISL